MSLSVFALSSLMKIDKYKAKLEESDTRITNDNPPTKYTGMWKRSDANKPRIKILVIDGGGLRGCMSVQILKAIETEIQRYSGDNTLKLGDVFDMIVGTSTGINKYIYILLFIHIVYE